MACDYTALSAYLDGELEEVERRRMEAHVKECTDCAAELQSLERVKAMVTACAIPVGMHGRLVARLEQEKRTRRVDARTWGWLAAAAAVVLAVAGAAYFGFGGKTPEEGPKGPNLAPAVAANAPSERREVAQVENTVPASPVESAPAAPMQATQLGLQLKGTVMGAMPQAIIVKTDTGKSAAYGVGKEVLPGLRVAEVRDKEVLLTDEQGRQVMLGMGASPAVEAKSLTGMWEASQYDAGDNLRDKSRIAITDEGGKVTAQPLAEEGKGNPGPALEGQRSGQKLVLAAGAEGISVSFEGSIDEDYQKISGRLTQTYTGDPDAQQVSKFEMVRIADEDVKKETEEAKLDEARKGELAAMYAPLKQFADEHDGKFPAALSELTHGILTNLAVYANTPSRTVSYVPGALLAPWKMLGFDVDKSNFSTEEWLAVERELRNLWGVNIPFRVVLKVTFFNPAAKYVVSSTGIVAKTGVSQAAQGANGKDAAMVDRAKSQNNLKQWGVVGKMFAGEHKGHTTPGWLVVYPEYVSDASICTAPWDEPGTESYELLFPGVTERELQDLALEVAMSGKGDPSMPKDPNDPALQAHAESHVPIMVERRADPRMPGGRNVLFLDGHVEWIANQNWKSRVDDYRR
jgi:prepilin-type processing-associated H-X9-DG protein